MTPAEFRRQVREGRFQGPTAGQCGGFAQANLAILPQAQADAFLAFCRANDRACPLLAVAEPGQGALPALGEDLDVRTDLPGYCVYRDGQLTETRRSIRDLWQPDLVAFAIGCSFSFEQALLAAGIPVRHLEEGRNVPMYRTRIANVPVPPFAGRMVVSMRPMPAADAIRAVQITSRFPRVHGAPVHLGDPALIGIADLERPDYGDPVTVRPGELPVFWACGVTPQDAIREARLPLAITHRPGHMLVTDLSNEALAVP
jgi:uncharacterized protein YcsI (UPF0317 family)